MLGTMWSEQLDKRQTLFGALAADLECPHWDLPELHVWHWHEQSLCVCVYVYTYIYIYIYPPTPADARGSAPGNNTFDSLTLVAAAASPRAACFWRSFHPSVAWCFGVAKGPFWRLAAPPLAARPAAAAGAAAAAGPAAAIALFILESRRDVKPRGTCFWRSFHPSVAWCFGVAKGAFWRLAAPPLVAAAAAAAAAGAAAAGPAAAIASFSMRFRIRYSREFFGAVLELVRPSEARCFPPGRWFFRSCFTAAAAGNRSCRKRLFF